MASVIPSREHSHFNLQQASQPDPALEDRLCPGCKRSAVNEQGGLVVAFGSSFFHVDCFKCAKCHNQVTADTNLLLLSDGSPICANCSYSCNVCKQPILDEAIMAGDDSYHAHCFKCKVCKERIDELVFAKTSQGIYCMKCHNERMIRIRKHAQKKAEREKALNGGSTSSKSRDREARTHHQDAQPTTSGNATPQYQDPSHKPPDLAATPSRPEITPQNPSQTLDISARSTPAPSPYAPVFSPNFNVSVTVDSPPRTSSIEALRNYDRGPPKQSTLPLPNNLSSRDARRSVSYDNGLNLPNEFGQQSQPAAPGSLSVGTSRQEKRRSINPGLSLNAFDFTSLASAANPSPLSDSSQLTATASTPPQSLDGHQLNGQDSGRRSSTTDSLYATHSHSSHQPISRSRSPSIVTQDYDQQEDTVILKSPSASTFPQRNEGSYSQAGLSPNDPRSAFATQQQQQRLSVNSTHSYDTHRSGGSRSASPAYRADVPHGVESGTDTDDDGPPLPPPKDVRAMTKSPDYHSDSFGSQDHDSSDADMEQPQIERHTHSTYIAPALPPIRVSLTSEFSEFLNGKSIHDLAKLAENGVVPPSSTQAPQSFLPNISEDEPDTPTVEDSSSHGHGSNTGHTERSDSASSTNSTSLRTNFTPSVSVTPAQPAPGPSALGPRQKASGADIVTVRLREALENAKERGAQQLKLDRAFVEAILGALDSRTSDLNQMKAKFDGVKRASRQYIEGFQVAQTEYDRELKARRDAEAEVTRLRVLLSGQAARLTALTGDSKRAEVRQQMTKDLSDSLHGLESDLSRLKAERDMTLVEMEELSASKSSGQEVAPSALSRALTKRLDGLRSQYQQNLSVLQQEQEHLNREIVELRAVRDLFLEETATLNARNEELAQLSTVYTRRLDAIPEAPAPIRNGAQQPMVPRPGVPPQAGLAPSLSASTSSSSTVHEDPNDIRHAITPIKKFKWMGSKGKDAAASASNGVEFSKSKAHIEHNFQQVSLLNLNTRCKHCGDKLWGSQLRCTVCSTSIHVRCIANVQIPCVQPNGMSTREENQAPLPPSMFGRDLVEQVQADARGTDRQVPVIVEKCIDAVEAIALDYEGIYRKTGGSGQQRTITQLFERGEYDSFDLLDSDRFNDICSVTSVLKTYFRSLPIPLLTYDLYDNFIQATMHRDPAVKHRTLIDLVKQLPPEHYFTLRRLSIHLHHVQLLKDINRMDARNLGVVFGPTLMKSRDPGAEFSDMAGKSLFIQWLIENAPEIFDVQDNM